MYEEQTYQVQKYVYINVHTIYTQYFNATIEDVGGITEIINIVLF